MSKTKYQEFLFKKKNPSEYGAILRFLYEKSNRFINFLPVWDIFIDFKSRKIIDLGRKTERNFLCQMQNKKQQSSKQKLVHYFVEFIKSDLKTI